MLVAVMHGHNRCSIFKVFFVHSGHIGARLLVLLLAVSSLKDQSRAFLVPFGELVLVARLLNHLVDLVSHLLVLSQKVWIVV